MLIKLSSNLHSMFASDERRIPPSTLFPYTTLSRSPTRCWPSAGPSPTVSGPPASAAALRKAQPRKPGDRTPRAEEHTSELQSPYELVCRLLLEKKKTHKA